MSSPLPSPNDSQDEDFTWEMPKTRKLVHHHLQSSTDEEVISEKPKRKKKRVKRKSSSNTTVGPASTADNPGYTCSICDKQFEKLSGLRSHEARVHVKNGEDRVWHCSIAHCGSVFSTAEEMEEHVIDDHEVQRFRRVRSANRAIPVIVDGVRVLGSYISSNNRWDKHDYENVVKELVESDDALVSPVQRRIRQVQSNAPSTEILDKSAETIQQRSDVEQVPTPPPMRIKLINVGGKVGLPPKQVPPSPRAKTAQILANLNACHSDLFIDPLTSPPTNAQSPIVTRPSAHLFSSPRVPDFSPSASYSFIQPTSSSVTPLKNVFFKETWPIPSSLPSSPIKRYEDW